jgi:hypothetical protein
MQLLARVAVCSDARRLIDVTQAHLVGSYHSGPAGGFLAIVPLVVEFADEFEAQFDGLPVAVQDELFAQTKVIEQFGPRPKQPRADTLNASTHANMKELRFDANGGVWRVPFAFDPRRKAVLLVASGKLGGSETRFYRRFIAVADERFDAHIERLKPKRER